jgi:uncharacterized membrane protein
MNLAPIFDAPLAVQIHVYTVVPAAIIGAFILLNRKGTFLHKLLGRIWIALMVSTSLSTFFIHSINLFYGFSPIHLLSAYVIFGAFMAIREVRRGNIAAHQKQVTGMYLGGIVLAGLFTFIPGRIMNEVVFDGFAFNALTDLRMIGWISALVAGLAAFALTILPSRLWK